MAQPDQIDVKQLSYFGAIRGRHRILSVEPLYDFNARFLFGRSYVLNSYPTDGGCAVSWLISGHHKPHQGQILFNQRKVKRAFLKQLSWRISASVITRLGREASLETQLRNGIDRGYSVPQWTFEEYQQQFALDPRTLSQKLTHISGNHIHCSCAVGLANGRRIFCFPYFTTWRMNMIDDYKYRVVPLEALIKLLTSLNCLVILSMLMQPRFAGLCDEVIDMYPKDYEADLLLRQQEIRDYLKTISYKRTSLPDFP